MEKIIDKINKKFLKNRDLMLEQCKVFQSTDSNDRFKKLIDEKVFKPLQKSVNPFLKRQLQPGIRSTKTNKDQDNKQQVIVRQNRYITSKQAPIRQQSQEESDLCRLRRACTYEFKGSDQFKDKYFRHLIQTIRRINVDNQYLARYRVLAKIYNKKKSEIIQKIKLQIYSAESGFDQKKSGGQLALIINLRKEEALNWLFCFTKMLIELETKKIYHLDLKVGNTIKLKSIFLLIDFQYSIRIDEQEQLKNLIQLWIQQNNPENQIFEHVFKHADQKMVEKFIDQKLLSNLPNHPEISNQFLSIINKINQTIQNLREKCQKLAFKKDKANKKAVEQFSKKIKQYLHYIHKLDFLQVLTFFVCSAKQLSEHTYAILKKISQLNPFDNSNMYQQFLGKLGRNQKCNYVTIEKTLPFTEQLQNQTSQSIIKLALENHSCISKFLNKHRGDLYQHQTNSSIISNQKSQGVFSYEVFNTFRQFAHIFELKRARYICYFLQCAFEAINQLSNLGIYFYHLSASDFVLEGEKFIIRNFSKALKLYKHKRQIDNEEKNALKSSYDLLPALIKQYSHLQTIYTYYQSYVLNRQDKKNQKNHQKIDESAKQLELKIQNMRTILFNLVNQLKQSYEINKKQIIEDQNQKLAFNKVFNIVQKILKQLSFEEFAKNLKKDRQEERFQVFKRFKQDIKEMFQVLLKSGMVSDKTSILN